MFKFHYPYLTLMVGPKVKSNTSGGVQGQIWSHQNIRSLWFPVGWFPCQTSRTSNKGDIDTFKADYMGYFGISLMTLNDKLQG